MHLTMLWPHKMCNKVYIESKYLFLKLCFSFNTMTSPLGGAKEHFVNKIIFRPILTEEKDKSTVEDVE